jgi:outer membrane receptor protein involved in Fe transport
VGNIALTHDAHIYRSCTLQDQFDLGTRWTLTGGVRYDAFGQVDSRVSPLLGALFRIGEHHSLKAQYTEGFRTPTVVELYSGGSFNGDLDFETIATSEIEYIYRDERTVFRATAYHEDVQALIVPRQGGRGHVNQGDLQADGVELELSRQITPWLKVMATASHGDTSDSRNELAGRPRDSFGKADWLGNLALIARPADDWDVGVHLNHVGDRVATNNTKVDGYDRVDAALTYRVPRVAGLMLRLGARNLFDAKVTYLLFQPNNPRLLDYGGRQVDLTLDWSL